MRKLLIIFGLLQIGSVWLQSKSALPFVEDNYAKALADAKARRVPLFVEAWAPW